MDPNARYVQGIRYNPPPLLKQSLQRLGLPVKIIEVIMDIFNRKTNQVITTIGKTKKYEVADGIDQGETLSPILCCIYYDPLLSKVQKTHKGYTMSVTIPDKEVTYTHSTSVIAYMDDTVWVAQSRLELEEIIKTASSFYEFANIRVNPSKSVLLHNNSSDHTPITFRTETIHNMGKNVPVRYLGTWVARSNNTKQIQNKIIHEAKIAINRLNLAKITIKQAIYIVNTVIITRIAYRVQNAYLPKSK